MAKILEYIFLYSIAKREILAMYVIQF